jgi:hypothetical protein
MTVEERSALGISYWKIGHIAASRMHVGAGNLVQI